MDLDLAEFHIKLIAYVYVFPTFDYVRNLL